MTQRSVLALSAAFTLAVAPPLSLGLQPAATSPLIGEVERLTAVARNAAPEAQQQARAALREARLKLIESAPEDWRAPTWILDHAADLTNELSLSGAEASALAGIPTPQQRTTAHETAWEVFQLAARADDAAARLVRRLETAPDLASPVALGQDVPIQDALSILIDQEQSVRVPYYRGRAAATLAALEADAAPRADYARVAMESLSGLRLATVQAEATRRTILATALLSISQDEKPRAQARELARWVLDQPVAPNADAPDGLSRVLALMVLARSARGEAEVRDAWSTLSFATKSEPFVASGEPVHALTLLVAEGKSRGLLEDPSRQTSDAALRNSRLNAAIAPLADLADAAPADASLRTLALAKVGAIAESLIAAGDRPAFDQLDPRFGFARAVQLGQRAGLDAAGAPSKRAEAMQLLEMVASRPESGPLRAEALWELAVVQWAAGDAGSIATSVSAVETLARLCREFPESARAAEAALKTVEMARYCLARLQTEDPALESPESRARLTQRLASIYGDALERAFQLRPTDPDAAAWRIDRAKIALESGGQVMGAASLEVALDALEGVPASGARGEDARTLAMAALDRALAAARTAASVSTDEPARTEALKRIAEIARRGMQWAETRSPDDAWRYRLALGDSLASVGDARALQVLSPLIERQGSGAGTPGVDQQALALAYGRALRTAGEGSKAFTHLREFVEQLDDAAAAPGGSPIRPAPYWDAWAEMLEILAGDNAEGTRTDAIRVQISRLALIDPAFGGGAGAGRIKAVQRIVGP